MIVKRASHERGHANHGWLDTYHTFSFAGYYDPDHMGFGPLRVINQDAVGPGAGFGTHPHSDMEIVTYVVEGALEHRDSMGNGSVMRPGDVQRMTAGTGVAHSEFNHSKTDPVKFLQIWILPERRGLEPGYEQKRFDRDEKLNRLRLVASRDGREGSLIVHQNVDLYACLLEPGSTAEHELANGGRAWAQVIKGRVRLNDALLEAGDGAALTDERRLTVTADEESELLLFDLG